jgi:hypothetical protein
VHIRAKETHSPRRHGRRHAQAPFRGLTWGSTWDPRESISPNWKLRGNAAYTVWQSDEPVAAHAHAVSHKMAMKGRIGPFPALRLLIA